ncbi:hypothetical protein [Viridibacillus arvi]|uniref:HD family phosphohydrolase n=1 Tax=Viridibacillus arvi TaxID=263475 RepID=A0A0M0LN07_9BACL|nr:hypothetical protein [Viridibacillus arvi]KOO52088.1 hypothetical protein AMD00_06650 [Viridibacillus arvi]
MTTFFGIGIYLIFQFSIVFVCILLGYFIYDKRYKRNHGNKVPKGFEVTNEVNLDPVTGEKIRVYYNAETGERFYRKEN